MDKIVIIDPNINLAYRIKKTLINKKREIILCDNAIDGMEVIKSNLPDLIIMEILLSEKDGFEIFCETRNVLPDTKIIAMTSGGLKHAEYYLEAMKLMGVDLTIKKPFRDLYLKSTVDTLLNNSSFFV